ncbi:hypothetical protein B0H14DRAFT_1032135 [Mycena olivaceomarginata]|nr:hypothetical protein B0H14DRAFT_1032135 [Mycena olivaceomarginata]
MRPSSSRQIGASGRRLWAGDDKRDLESQVLCTCACPSLRCLYSYAHPSTTDTCAAVVGFFTKIQAIKSRLDLLHQHSVEPSSLSAPDAKFLLQPHIVISILVFAVFKHLVPRPLNTQSNCLNTHLCKALKSLSSCGHLSSCQISSILCRNWPHNTSNVSDLSTRPSCCVA